MKIVRLCILLLISNCGFIYAQSGYTLDCDFTGFKDGTWFRLYNIDTGMITDSTTILNGKFIFRGHLEGPQTARIHTIDGKYLIIYLENKNIKLTGSADNFFNPKIEGSEIDSFWVKSRDHNEKNRVERDSLMRIIFEKMNTDSTYALRLNKRVNEIDRIDKNYQIEFVKNEKPSYFSLQQLYYLSFSLSPAELEHLFEKFPDSLKNSKNGQVISLKIKSVRLVAGKPLLDIESADTAGKMIRLNDLNGHYVLLNFWASWCGPCRMEHPVLISLYKKYHDKGFEIFSFSLDLDKKDWLAAIKSDQLSWINVSDQKGYYSPFVLNYGVKGVPTNVLIDPKGIIVGLNIDSDGLDQKLGLLLGN